jgi:hypothetical protein
VGGGCEKSRGGRFCKVVLAVVRALREVREDHQQPCSEKLSIQNAPDITVIFIGALRP